MNKETCISSIRKVVLDLPIDSFTIILEEFQLMSYSKKCLNEMSLVRLRELLRMIKYNLSIDVARIAMVPRQIKQAQQFKKWKRFRN